MKNIGLTGGIGSGKSTVSKILISEGIPVYDSDSRAKILMNSSIELKKNIIQKFLLKILIFFLYGMQIQF